ncbi:MAG: hypothetical protein CBD03_02000 [Rhizobiales bacterium TMED143]|nr:DNA gyrase inhibitor YacG [Rhodobiaceae bacterium]MBL6787286.1 DNA gyrase inhibitor YacG [PS1 clade bacterium]OUV92982.1 MAG: hypothetical protein CBD03_02000 [Rhizobiales bacterium TMED143]HCQ82710.1 DNA gyrase inhibitor YacG [Rhodobiaceae bacterium]|tara:strand:- start:87 stop:287 length:201 start_codon:yes stop_codon:yes gene_type:complete
MAKCPICKSAETQAMHRPFCSKRCADIDLHRWLGGNYAIPAVEPPDDFDGEIEAALRDADISDEIH